MFGGDGVRRQRLIVERRVFSTSAAVCLVSCEVSQSRSDSPALLALSRPFPSPQLIPNQTQHPSSHLSAL